MTIEEIHREPETVIVVKERSTIMSVLVGIVRVVVVFAVLGAAAYGFLNYTDMGERMLDKYRVAVEKTERKMDSNLMVIRFYIASYGRPPRNFEELDCLETERLKTPFRPYYLNGQRVPLYSEEDQFGHRFRYSVDEQAREVTLTSTGIFGIRGVMNITKTINY